MSSAEKPNLRALKRNELNLEDCGNLPARKIDFTSVYTVV